MLNAVIDFLKTRSFKELTDELGVNVRPSADFSKFSLNYNQIAANPAELLHRECRGLIVRPVQRLNKHDWNTSIVGDVVIVACPMPRFFNAGDVNAANVDWSDASLKVFEKLDGTMCAVYFDAAKSAWCVATRSVPEADLIINDSDYTFHKLFMEGFYNTVGEHCMSDFFKFVDKQQTYVFELTSPLNRVVVAYNETRVTLLAVRDNETGDERNIDAYARAYCIPMAKTWSLSTIDDLNKFVDDANPLECEGAVVCDSNFNRIKVKNKTYVMISKAYDVVSSNRNVVKLIISEKLDDVIVHFEDKLRTRLVGHQNDFRSMCQTIDENFSRWKNATETRKDFAKIVLESTKLHQVYFALWEGKCSTAANWFKDTHDRDRVTRSLLDVVWHQMYGVIPAEVEETRE